VATPLQIKGRLLARNALWNLFGQVIPALIAFGVTPLVLEELGKERFGILAFSWVILSYFTLFDLGIGRSSERYVAEALGKSDSERAGSVVRSALIMQVVLGLLVGALLFAGVPLLAKHVWKLSPDFVEEAVHALRLLGLFLPFSMGSAVLSGALSAGQRFGLVNLVRIPSASLNFLLPLLALLFDVRDLRTIVLLLLGKTVVAAVVAFTICCAVYPSLRRRTSSFDRTLAKQIVAYGVWVFVHVIVASLLPTVDTLLIGALLTVAMLPYYAIPYDFVSRLSIIPSSVVMTLFPAFSAIGLERREELLRIYAKAVRFTLALTAPLTVIGLYFFGWEILSLWLGRDFADVSITAFRWLTVASLIGTVAHLPIALLQAVGRPDIITKTIVLELPLYVASSWLAIRQLGIVGPAVAWTALAAANAVIFITAVARLTGAGVAFYARARLVAAFLVTVASATVSAIAAPLLDPRIEAKLIVGTLLALGTGVATWKLVFDSADRELALRLPRSLNWRLRQLAYRVRNFLLRSAPVDMRLHDVTVKLVSWGLCVRGYWTGTYFEKHELGWILNHLKNGGVFFDVGANVGMFSLAVARKFPASIVHAFEPCAATYEILQRNIALNQLRNVFAVRTALGDVNGEADLLVNARGLDGLNTIGKEATHSDAVVVGRETVPLLTLERYLEANGISRIDCVKIDVEGAELPVLRGAEKVLRSPDAPVILFEYPGLTAKGFGYEPAECLRWLRECGYSLWELAEADGALTPLSNDEPRSRTIIASKGDPCP